MKRAPKANVLTADASRWSLPAAKYQGGAGGIIASIEYNISLNTGAQLPEWSFSPTSRPEVKAARACSMGWSSATQMRAQLEESLASISEIRSTLRGDDIVMEALKTFTSAAQMIREGRDRSAAAALLNNAIRLDPTSPWLTSVGVATAPREKAAFYTKNRAYELRPGERTGKASITSGYHWLVTGDADKELRNQSPVERRIPATICRCKTETSIGCTGQYEKAVELLKQGWQFRNRRPAPQVFTCVTWPSTEHPEEAGNLWILAFGRSDTWSVHAAPSPPPQCRGQSLEAERRRWSGSRRQLSSDRIWAARPSAQPIMRRKVWAKSKATLRLDSSNLMSAAGHNQ